MRRNRFALVLVATGTLWASSALADETIQVTNAWVRPTRPGVTTSVLYLTLTNDGPQADTLLAVATPAASEATLHESAAANGVVTMRPLPQLELPPKSSIPFEPKGKHVMLTGVSKKLAVGDHVPVALTFKAHLPVTVEAVVSMTAPK
jgi:copper(I)-binding protein